MILPLATPDDARAAVHIVAPHLAAGRLLGYPTETVYGLGSGPNDPGVTALATLKGRLARKPFLLLVDGRAMAEKWGLVFGPSANALAEAYWPGALTLVLLGGEGRLPDRLRGPEGGIAVRHTSHVAIATLVHELGHPLTSTSANRPGGPPAPGAHRLAELFQEAVDVGQLIVLDGGVLGNVPPSTIVDCTSRVPAMVREGAIPRAELRRMVGSLAP